MLFERGFTRKMFLPEAEELFRLTISSSNVFKRALTQIRFERHSMSSVIDKIWIDISLGVMDSN